MRVTKASLRAQISIVNRMIGHEKDPAYATEGALTLYCAHGGYGVHRYSGGHGGVSDLMGGCQPARECQAFLSGMIAALRITSD
jgi:hypothetical protein